MSKSDASFKKGDRVRFKADAWQGLYYEDNPLKLAKVGYVRNIPSTLDHPMPVIDVIVGHAKNAVLCTIRTVDLELDVDLIEELGSEEV